MEMVMFQQGAVKLLCSIAMFNCATQQCGGMHTYIYVYLCIHIYLWCNTKLSLQEDHYKQSEQTAAAACDRCGEKKMEMVMFQQGAVKLLCSVAMFS